jgi:hypothetical protein
MCLLLGTVSGDEFVAEDCGPIIFVKRQHFDRPFGIGSIVGWDIYKPGGGIYVYDPRHPNRNPREVFRRDDGVVFDFSLSFDAKKILFSWRRCRGAEAGPDSEAECFHIYEMNVDGSDLRQLTGGPYQDVRPFYLPDGRIGFVSTRVESFTMCQPGAGCALHVMERDGSDIQRIHFGTLADHSPFVLDNGSILFTRWEYQDKDLTYLQGLWTVNPDGTRVQLFFGNTVLEPAVIWQATPIPGPSKVLCTLAPHHGNPVGAVGVIDRSRGLENPAGIINLTPEIDYDPQRGKRGPGDRQFVGAYRDPFPIRDGLYLVSYGGGEENRYRLCLMNDQGKKRVVYEDPSLSCFNAVPLAPRKKPLVLAPLVQDDVAEGTFLVADVYRGMTGVERGEVKALRVMTVPAKPCNMRGLRGWDMDPLMGRGTYYAKICLGTVPVDDNGCAYFKAPAGQEIYFQALDGGGKELFRMGSITQLMPGETQGCVGCHESRFSTPTNRAELAEAVARGPVSITPPPWGTGPVDFVAQVQPVLDRYCVDCHSGPKPDGLVDLSGDKTRFFNMAYDTLTESRFVDFYWLAREAHVRNFRPLESGARASKLTELIESKHGDVVLDPESRQKIYTWIEANVPYYGTYDHTRPGLRGSRDAVQGTPWFPAFEEVYRRRCGDCHGAEFYVVNNGLHHTWLNLTHPEWSRALIAPLSRDAGGLALCKPQNGKQPRLFPDAQDPDYRTMLQALEEGKRLLYARPRMDMPGAVPVPYPTNYAGPYQGFAGP